MTAFFLALTHNKMRVPNAMHEMTHNSFDYHAVPRARLRMLIGREIHDQKCKHQENCALLMFCITLHLVNMEIGVRSNK